MGAAQTFVAMDVWFEWFPAGPEPGLERKSPRCLPKTGEGLLLTRRGAEAQSAPSDVIVKDGDLQGPYCDVFSGMTAQVLSLQGRIYLHITVRHEKNC